MSSMSDGCERSGYEGNTTPQIPGSPRFAFGDADDSTEETRTVDLRTLSPGTSITVATRNSTYKLVLRDAETQTVTVEGGRYRDEPAEGRVAGTSINGIFLSEGRIDVRPLAGPGSRRTPPGHLSGAVDHGRLARQSRCCPSSC